MTIDNLDESFMSFDFEQMQLKIEPSKIIDNEPRVMFLQI
jgi:hypothetical protein